MNLLRKGAWSLRGLDKTPLRTHNKPRYQRYVPNVRSQKTCSTPLLKELYRNIISLKSHFKRPKKSRYNARLKACNVTPTRPRIQNRNPEPLPQGPRAPSMQIVPTSGSGGLFGAVDPRHCIPFSESLNPKNLNPKLNPKSLNPEP